MSEYSRVFLKNKEEQEIEQGYPWVFDNEISHVKFLADDGSGFKTSSLEDCMITDGEVVDVYNKAGGFLGCGVINRKSKITIRLIGRDHADKVMQDPKSYWSKVVRNAVNIRGLYYDKTDSYRLIFGEADLIPGLVADRYYSNGKVYIVVQFLALACEVFRKEILEALEESCKPYGIYERSDSSVRDKEGLEQVSGWIGQKRDGLLTIEENGIKLEVDIINGQKTGYFLDQKNNRAEVAQLCRGKKVLDTFTHTGAFGLNAVKGGAKEVISVDISEEAVSMVNKNIALNGCEDKMKAVCADVFDLLKEYEKTGEKFDVIILDPPAFTKSAKLTRKLMADIKKSTYVL